MQDIRGTGKSSIFICDNPPVGNFNPYNESLVRDYDECHKNLAVKYAGMNQYFTAYHGALDVKSSLDLINPKVVNVYATSVGTWYANIFMQLPGIRIDSVILDGPIPPGININCCYIYCSNECIK